MSIETIGAPVQPVADSTYTIADSDDANYTTTAGTVTGANKTLSLRMLWPDVDDPESPRPLVIYVNTLGWSTSNSTGANSLIETYILGSGVICAAIQTRVIGDDPLSVGESASMNVYRRAMRAAVLDTNTALRYILANYSEHASGVIEPSMIFLAGVSAGAVTSLSYPLVFPGHSLAGVIGWACAFGADSIGGTSYTNELRGNLSYRETYLKTPTCAFVGGADTTIGTTYIELLRTKLSTNASNVVHYDADGVHGNSGPGAFDVTALTDASTVAEAVSNFLRARCRAIVPVRDLRKNGMAWRKNWLKMESRYQ